MKITTRETVVYAMLGALMYISKIIMEIAPNIHLLGVFTMAFTIVYKKKALYPIYTYVFINGLMSGFSTWWVPYLYIWTILWWITMKLPNKIKNARLQTLIYMLVCGVHGLLYGTLYAPCQAIIMGLDFKGMISWIVAGLPFDLIHGISNFICGLLIVPISRILLKLEDQR